MSRVNGRVELTQLRAGALGREAPIHARPQPVALPGPRLYLPPQRLDVRQAPPQALAHQNRELDLHHVQPRAVNRRVDELHLPGQPAGLLGGEGRVEGGGRVGGEVVAYQPDLLGVRVGLLRQAAHRLGELPTAPPLAHLRLPPARERLEDHQHVGGAAPLVLVVAALGQACRHGQRLADLGQQLAGALVEADHREERIVRLLVEVEHGLHTPDERRVLVRRDHPPFDEVGTQLVFLSAFLTVSWETDSTIPSSTALSAKSRMLQRSRPSGASEQASAISRASARPSSDRSYTRSATDRSSAASSPCRKKRLRTRPTVATLVSRASAILSSVQRSGPWASALSRTRARLSILAGAVPDETSLPRRSRSAFVSSTTYFFLFTVGLPSVSDRHRGKAVRPARQITVDIGLVFSETYSRGSATATLATMGHGPVCFFRTYCTELTHVLGKTVESREVCKSQGR